MIKFLDLKLINKNFEKEFKARFDAFLNSGQYILGEEVLSKHIYSNYFSYFKYQVSASFSRA